MYTVVLIQSLLSIAGDRGKQAAEYKYRQCQHSYNRTRYVPSAMANQYVALYFAVPYSYSCSSCCCITHSSVNLAIEPGVEGEKEGTQPAVGSQLL
jgi:hypothetical protein